MKVKVKPYLNKIYAYTEKAISKMENYLKK